ncbi:formylglycine-generating enzyme family protein [Aerosakkonemataceae cyanobacterium BLCC-F154]|uniref:Formylglycine-generating enzyme family protein n=1 Tax=Floridaenema fluviatile BLCC-F154 TaxID=3153640 RepID=A0ABV4Y814_9CYAN
MSETSLEQKYARQQVDRFVRRFEPSYKKLAYYAALPLVLTPELLNYLRNQLLWEEGEDIPWVAEVDLLLSDICRPVGYEQYAMEPAVRAYLISEMEEVLGKKQIEAVARLLITYIKHLSQTNPYISSQELETQQWAAMVCIDDKRQEAVGQISQAYRKCIEATEGGGNPLLNRSEMERLSRITQELTSQLRDYPTLLAFAEVVRRLDADPTIVSDELLNRSWRVEDVELRLPNALVPSQKDTSNPASQLPNRRTFKFEEASIVFEGDTDLQPFEFEVATLNRDIIGFINELLFARKKYYLNDIQIQVLTEALNKKTYQEIAETLAYSLRDIQKIASELWKLLSEIFNTKVTKTNLKSLFVNRELVIHRTRQQAWGYSEDLGNDVLLEMVAIPEGSFMMGSPENESERSDNESPQHQVTVKSFFMGKYPVTQAQWKAIAVLPQINRELNPDPSSFKGANRPVECVSWLDAVEFCDRLSQHTKKPYRLPSEAEWEYACRAGTTTPFHFGETITTDLANYNGEYTYGAGSKGINRRETTPSGSFGVANAFGLYDMHGNVWEWCADRWHDNYEGAPNDGSAWVDENENKNDSQITRRLRGGSWHYTPVYCRSACRFDSNADDDLNYVGFRIVCSAEWTR